MQFLTGESTCYIRHLYPMVSLGLLTMADSLAARETYRVHKHTDNHTDVACMIQKQAVRTERPRLRARTNIHRPPKVPRGTLIDPVRSVHKCASSGTVRCVQMAGEVCVVMGLNGLGGFE